MRTSVRFRHDCYYCDLYRFWKVRGEETRRKSVSLCEVSISSPSCSRFPFSPTRWESIDALTPEAVLTGLALKTGNNKSLDSCGTALMISTNLGTTLLPCFFAIVVFNALRLMVCPFEWASRREETISEQTTIVCSAAVREGTVDTIACSVLGWVGGVELDWKEKRELVCLISGLVSSLSHPLKAISRPRKPFTYSSVTSTCRPLLHSVYGSSIKQEDSSILVLTQVTHPLSLPLTLPLSLDLINIPSPPMSEGLAALNSNDYLILASTFHSIHAIASRISPLDGPSSGIETIEAETFKMNCFQTPTGK